MQKVQYETHFPCVSVYSLLYLASFEAFLFLSLWFCRWEGREAENKDVLHFHRESAEDKQINAQCSATTSVQVNARTHKPQLTHLELVQRLFQGQVFSGGDIQALKWLNIKNRTWRCQNNIYSVVYMKWTNKQHNKVVILKLVFEFELW